MALENYLEMRDRVDDADFLLQRALERALAERHPDRFVPRYAMVTFLRMPYARRAASAARCSASMLVEADPRPRLARHAGLGRVDAEVERLPCR